MNQDNVGSLDLTDFLYRQREWSAKTFGPGRRTLDISEHIRKELLEIAADPADTQEWVDVVILGMDGYWRAGGDPARLMQALRAKQTINMARKWPVVVSEDLAVEHVKGPQIHGEPGA